MNRQPTVCATHDYALALQGEKRNVAYYRRLPRGKGQPTTQSWDNPLYEVRLRKRSHNIYSAKLRVGQNVSERH
jgi:hypothetical protein